MDVGTEHRPVLLNEVVAGLMGEPDGRYIDGTFGRGGHSGSILREMGAQGSLLAIDKDRQALASPQAAALMQDPRFELQQGSFVTMGQWAENRQWTGQVDGILLDLGVSSPQLDDPQRGFSFMHDGPLDMRMDPGVGQSAAEWLAGVEESELARVLRVYGEERFARKIARALVAARQEQPLLTTGQLAQRIESAVPRGKTGKHPATRSFQAIRIFLNGELSDLEEVLQQAPSILKSGGRLVVISFHSLEDRIVKRFLRDQSQAARPRRDLPLPPDAPQPLMKRVGKAIRASQQEVAENPRARSAVLRVGERL